MKNHLTHETAKRLKEAGFPQPEFECGQPWYAEPVYSGGTLEHAPLCFVAESYPTRGLTFRRLTVEHNAPERVQMRGIFAPTATDILEHLNGWRLAQSPSGSKRHWCCWKPQNEIPGVVRMADDDEFEFYHENPAEAAAIAWLFTKNKL